MKRTTIMMEEELLYQLKTIAQRERLSLAELIRKTLAEYVSQTESAGEHSSFYGLDDMIGMLNSSEDDISERFEEILEAEVHPIYGFGVPNDVRKEEPHLLEVQPQ